MGEERKRLRILESSFQYENSNGNTYEALTLYQALFYVLNMYKLFCVPSKREILENMKYFRVKDKRLKCTEIIEN